MKKIILSTLLVFLTFTIAIAQDYTTPNTGVTMTLADIAAASPSTITVSGNNYTLLGNLTVSENDTVVILTVSTVFIDADKLITVFGGFLVNANLTIFTAIDENAPYAGFRFEEFSDININNARIEHGGGLRVLTETFSIDYSTINNNVSGATTSAVIQVSRGRPEITHCTISFNKNPAVGSAANAAVSPIISNNIIEGNNTDNANRPQINLGTTLANEPAVIYGNTIIGDPALTEVGGIAMANFVGGSLNAVIDSNIIRGNRYGITILGSSDDVNISFNIIEDNNIQGDPNLGGSGINLNTTTASTTVVSRLNEIRRNLWGITLQGLASINLGDDIINDGQNVFSENGNGGEIYALYNNTPNPIIAKNNCWIEGEESTPEMVEDVIFHSVDDPNLGEVTFDPFLICDILGADDFSAENFSFYPNPVKNEINFNNILSFEKVAIYGIQGNLISSGTISEGQNTLPINLPSGLYFVNFSNDTQAVTKKMIVE